MTTNINSLELNKSYTYADYLKWHFEERLELIKGKIFKMAPAPDLEHQRSSVNLVLALGNFLKNKKCEVFTAPFDVRLTDSKKSGEDEDIQTVVQPDICVICDLSKLDRRGCLGAPDLIIEILSPSTAKKDLNDKYRIYEENGVKEYWVVSPREKFVQVFELNEQGKYQMRKAYDRTEKVPVGIFDDFSIDLSEVFPEEKY